MQTDKVANEFIVWFSRNRKNLNLQHSDILCIKIKFQQKIHFWDNQYINSCMDFCIFIMLTALRKCYYRIRSNLVSVQSWMWTRDIKKYSVSG